MPWRLQSRLEQGICCSLLFIYPSPRKNNENWKGVCNSPTCEGDQAAHQISQANVFSLHPLTLLHHFQEHHTTFWEHQNACSSVSTNDDLQHAAPKKRKILLTINVFQNAIHKQIQVYCIWHINELKIVPKLKKQNHICFLFNLWTI